MNVLRFGRENLADTRQEQAFLAVGCDFDCARADLNLQKAHGKSTTLQELLCRLSQSEPLQCELGTVKSGENLHENC